MLANGKDLYSFLDALFKPYGFKRKKDTYYLHSPETICFFSIGKSQFGGNFEHVMGCFLREIHPDIEEFPKYNKSDLKFSLRELADTELVKNVFDFEKRSFNDTQRETKIEELIINYAIPFLQDVSTVNGIRDSLVKYEKLQYWLTGRLTNYLNIPPSNS